MTYMMVINFSMDAGNFSKKGREKNSMRKGGFYLNKSKILVTTSYS